MQWFRGQGPSVWWAQHILRPQHSLMSLLQMGKKSCSSHIKEDNKLITTTCNNINGSSNIIMRGKFRYESRILYDDKAGQSSIGSPDIFYGLFNTIFSEVKQWFSYSLLDLVHDHTYLCTQEENRKKWTLSFSLAEQIYTLPSLQPLMPEIGLQRRKDRALWEKSQTENTDVCTLCYIEMLYIHAPISLWPSLKTSSLRRSA